MAKNLAGSRIALAFAVLVALGIMLWRRSTEAPESIESQPTASELVPASVATGTTGPTAAPASISRQIRTDGVNSDLADIQAADARGELPGKYGTQTPEELLFDIAELRAEPFAPLVLDKLEESFKKLKSLADQVRAAVLLHRYGRQSGTSFLREQLRKSSDSAESFPIAATLAMARDQESLPILVQGLAQFATDPEFARAAAAWGDPALIEKARTLLHDSSAPRGILANLLAMAGDQSALGTLTDLAAKTPPQNPNHFNYQAALVRLGAAQPDPLLQKMQEAAAQPNRVLAFLSDSAALLGSERAAPFLENLVDTYAGRRQTFGEQYDQHAVGVQNGTRSIQQMPPYPIMEERRMLEAVAILGQWKTPSAVEPIYRALQEAQTGRYSVLLNRQLMAAATQVDPTGSGDRILALGFPQQEVDASRKLTQLRSVAQAFLPRQKTIALTKPSRAEPAN